MRILVVDDDEGMCQVVRTSLEAEHFAVDTANSGERGSYFARTNDYDLIVLDNRLGDKGGKDVCTEIRATGKTTPIIILSAVAHTAEKVELLNAGADDYVVKPFAFSELFARIRALLRRPETLLTEVLRLDTLSLNTRTQAVERGNRTIYLTRKEYMLLEYLLRHEGTVLSRGMLMEHVWDMRVDPFSNTIESHMASLRKKIENQNEQKLIHTVPGRGYRIAAHA